MCARTPVHQENPKSITFQCLTCVHGHISLNKKIQNLSHSSMLYVRSDTSPSSRKSKVYHIPVSSMCARTHFLHKEYPKTFTFQYPPWQLFLIVFSLPCVKTDGNYSKKIIANFSYPIYNLTIASFDTNFIFNSFFSKKKKNILQSIFYRT